MNLVGRYLNLKLNVSLPGGGGGGVKTNGSRCKIVQDSVLSVVAIYQKKKEHQFSMHACKVTSIYRGQYYSNKQLR